MTGLREELEELLLKPTPDYGVYGAALYGAKLALRAALLRLRVHHKDPTLPDDRRYRDGWDDFANSFGLEIQSLVDDLEEK